HYAFFRQLTAEQRDRLRQLDRDLQLQDPQTRAHLLEVLKRYVNWLHRLPAVDRQRVEAAASASERLALIRELRDRAWYERLPRADRERLEKAPEKERAALLEQLRREDRQRREEALLVTRFWKELQSNEKLPTSLKDLPADVQDFVEKTLRPMLSDEQWRRLQAAQGRWPQFPRTLVELVDQHPVVIPGPIGYTRIADLPEDVQKRLRLTKGSATERLLKQLEGRWPEFGLMVLDLAQKKAEPKKPVYRLPRVMTPSHPAEFSPAIQTFIEKELYPRLSREERDRLQEAEGKWPEYPQTLVELARKHRLSIPGMSLPGPADVWDRYRLRRPLARASGLKTGQRTPQVVWLADGEP
ncbi:MAG: hypothetical protein RMJ52_16555, partial [Gemmataceae bacterium]|nr:hypothetical protein [Gemmataceae bacterium]